MNINLFVCYLIKLWGIRTYVAVTQQCKIDVGCSCRAAPISSRGTTLKLISRQLFDIMVVLKSFLDFTSDGSKRDPKLISICNLDLASPITSSWRSSNQGKYK